MIEKLIKIANVLDSLGEYEIADELDAIIKEAWRVFPFGQRTKHPDWYQTEWPYKGTEEDLDALYESLMDAEDDFKAAREKYLATAENIAGTVNIPDVTRYVSDLKRLRLEFFTTGPDAMNIDKMISTDMFNKGVMKRHDEEPSPDDE